MDPMNAIENRAIVSTLPLGEGQSCERVSVSGFGEGTGHEHVRQNTDVGAIAFVALPIACGWSPPRSFFAAAQNLRPSPKGRVE